ncbi:unnamed protein product [Boreogadus saida]
MERQAGGGVELELSSLEQWVTHLFERTSCVYAQSPKDIPANGTDQPSLIHSWISELQGGNMSAEGLPVPLPCLPDGVMFSCGP